MVQRLRTLSAFPVPSHCQWVSGPQFARRDFSAFIENSEQFFSIGLVFILISEKIDYFLLKIIKILFIFCVNMIYIDKADNECFK